MIKARESFNLKKKYEQLTILLGFSVSLSQVGSGGGGILATTRTVNHSVVIYIRIALYSLSIGTPCQNLCLVRTKVFFLKIWQWRASWDVVSHYSALPPLSPSPRQATCAQSTDPTVCLLLTQISFYIDLHLSNWLIWWQSIHYRLGKKLSSLDFRRCKICIRLVV